MQLSVKDLQLQLSLGTTSGVLPQRHPMTVVQQHLIRYRPTARSAPESAKGPGLSAHVLQSHSYSAPSSQQAALNHLNQNRPPVYCTRGAPMAGVGAHVAQAIANTPRKASET